ncbi:MAG: hypothetical protein HY288_04605 [Planctomycetia bacterium]|nr:hypothetical protein [Planctomycetia bacterium]
MIHPRLHQLTTLGLLIAYLAASSVVGLLHDHDEALPSASAAGPSTKDVAVLSIGSADDHSAHDDDCAICRFLGQRSLSHAIRPIDRLCKLCVELTLVYASQSASPIARTTHSRAPPLFG